MTSEQTTQPKRVAPAQLWRAMRAFLCLLFDLFGEPSDIAASGALSRKTRALIAPWLRAGEAFMRRLLFIEALALNVDTPRAAPAKRQPHTRKLCYFYPDKPEEWRVSFRVLAGARRLHSAGGRHRERCKPLALPPGLVLAARPQSCEFAHARQLARRGAARHPRQTAPRAARNSDDAWPFAERLEAMVRVFNEPRAAALRLARIMRRDEARARSALRPAPQGCVELFGTHYFARCDAIAASRQRRRDRPGPAEPSPLDST